MLNVHFSLLPRWRGAAPVERAVLAGDAETGVCLMALEEGLDTGPVYDRVVTPIGPDETADDLRRRLGEIGNELLLARLSAGLGEPRPQTGEPTYAAKLEPAELHLDFSRAAEVCNRQVQGGQGVDDVAGEAVACSSGTGGRRRRDAFARGDRGGQSGDR